MSHLAPFLKPCTVVLKKITVDLGKNVSSTPESTSGTSQDVPYVALQIQKDKAENEKLMKVAVQKRSNEVPSPSFLKQCYVVLEKIDLTNKSPSATKSTCSTINNVPDAALQMKEKAAESEFPVEDVFADGKWPDEMDEASSLDFKAEDDSKFSQEEFNMETEDDFIKKNDLKEDKFRLLDSSEASEVLEVEDALDDGHNTSPETTPSAATEQNSAFTEEKVSFKSEAGHREENIILDGHNSIVNSGKKVITISLNIKMAQNISDSVTSSYSGEGQNLQVPASSACPIQTEHYNAGIERLAASLSEKSFQPLEIDPGAKNRPVISALSARGNNQVKNSFAQSCARIVPDEMLFSTEKTIPPPNSLSKRGNNQLKNGFVQSWAGIVPDEVLFSTEKIMPPPNLSSNRVNNQLKNSFAQSCAGIVPDEVLLSTKKIKPPLNSSFDHGNNQPMNSFAQNCAGIVPDEMLFSTEKIIPPPNSSYDSGNNQLQNGFFQSCAGITPDKVLFPTEKIIPPPNLLSGDDKRFLTPPDPLQCDFSDCSTDKDRPMESSGSMSFSSKASSTPTDEKSFSCKHCSAKFKTSIESKIHFITHHKVTWSKHCCPICLVQFATKIDIESRVQQHTNDRLFSCTECSAQFITEPILEQHILLVHSADRPYPCSQCSAQFNTKQILRHHILSVHSDDKPFSCDQCPARFKLKTNFNEHLRIHSKDRPFVFNHCSSRLKRKRDLKQHLPTHSDEKPYTCEQCPAKFKYSRSLVYHTKKHASGKLPSCDQYSSQWTTDSDEKPYACKQCSARFKTGRFLAIHTENHLSELTHSDRARYTCDRCPASFKQQRSLVSHIKRHSAGELFRNQYSSQLKKRCDVSNPPSGEICVEEIPSTANIAQKTSSEAEHYSGKVDQPASSPSQHRSYRQKFEADSQNNSAIPFLTSPSVCENKSVEYISNTTLQNVIETVSHDTPLLTTQCPSLSTSVSSFKDCSPSYFDSTWQFVECSAAVTHPVFSVNEKLLAPFNSTLAVNTHSPIYSDSSQCVFVDGSITVKNAVPSDSDNCVNGNSRLPMSESTSSLKPGLWPSNEETHSNVLFQAPFKNNVEFKNHFPTHANPYCFPNSRCSTQFMASNALKLHAPKHTNEERLSYSQCPLFEDSSSHQNHLQYDSLTKPLSCGRWSVQSKSKDKLAKHLSTYSDERPFPCPKCSIRCKSKNGLRIHFSWFHSPEDAKSKRKSSKAKKSKSPPAPQDFVFVDCSAEMENEGCMDVSMSGG